MRPRARSVSTSPSWARTRPCSRSGRSRSKGAATTLNLSSRGDLEEAAANLFAMLRALDRPEFRAIAVMPVPGDGLGEAICDRLRRAAAPRPTARRRARSEAGLLSFQRGTMRN